MTAFDFAPLFRTAIGFERFPSLFDTALRLNESVDSYPPYDIEKLGENSYRIVMAVAGFGKDELEVEVKENTLSIRGNKAEESEKKEYLHRGIAKRSFERRFQLADHVQVSGADVVDGLLHIDLVREIPERMKPRRIEIGSPTSKQIEGQTAA